MSSVSFHNADVKPPIKDKTILKQFIPTIFSEYNRLLQSLTIVFCSDSYLLSLNKKFLQHDYYTDILTFDLSSSNKVTAEIYISIERVQENAFFVNSTFYDELLRIIFHGVLHLCGFGDKSVKDKKKMTVLENETLVKFSAFHVKQ